MREKLHKGKGRGIHSIIVLMSFMLFSLLSSVCAEEKRYVVPLEDSPSLGPQDALVTIIEFLDFQ